jgi:glycolate oxidase iron-sulfur subunit
MAVCPVYEVMQREGGSARGKLELVSALAAGELPDTRRVQALLHACVLCGRCRDECPHEVDTPRVVRAARAELHARGRTGFVERFLVRRLPDRRALTALLKAARGFRWLWARRLPGDSGLGLRFARWPGGRGRRLPPLARPFFLERARPEPVGRGPRVRLFVGCVNNYLRPEAAEAAWSVLAGLGARVAAPAAQACCGLVAVGLGDRETARRLAARNLEALWPAGEEPPEAVTGPCASCVWALAHHLPELLAGDATQAERARRLAARVVPFSVLAARLAGLDGEGTGREAPAELPALTFHDPCHLSRGFGEKDAPRHLLTRLAGARFVETDHPCHCCGQGGSFGLHHPALSEALARDKAARLRATGARYVVTECSGCVLQLQDILSREGERLEVLTTPEAMRLLGGAPACPGSGRGGQGC